MPEAQLVHKVLQGHRVVRVLKEPMVLRVQQVPKVIKELMGRVSLIGSQQMLVILTVMV